MNREKRISFGLGILLLLVSVLGGIQWVARHQYLTRGWEKGIPAPVFDTSSGGSSSKHTPNLDAPCVNTALERYSASELSTALGWITDGGFQWVRQKFSWAEIEVEPGKYDWSAWDTRIKLLVDQNIGLLAVLDQAPLWAGIPPDAEAFAAFAGEFAKRYGQQITYYQIWHNVNIGDAWGGYANAYTYTELLALAGQAIREVDTDARIILGSLAPNVEMGDRNYAEPIFLEMLYASGAQPYFDVVAVQPYGFDSGPGDRRVQRDVLNFSRVQLVRQVLVDHGDAHKAVWASHFGWNNLPENWPGTASIWGSVDEQDQADFTTAAFQRAAREWPWMGVMCVNNLQPRPPQDAQQIPDAEEHWGFALIGPKGEARPVYQAIKEWVVGNQGANSGTYPADTAYADYEGSWILGPQGADIGETGDRVTIDFTGTGLAVTVRRGPYRAFLFAAVDGQPAPALPKDREGQAYIVLYDPLAAVVTVPLAEGLPYGQHQAVLVAERGWGQWAIADWRVIDAPEDQRYIWGLVIYCGLGLLGTLCVFTARDLYQSTHILTRLRSFWEGCTNLVKALISIAAGALYLFAAWHLFIGDGLFRRLGEHGDWLALVLSAGLFYFSHWLLLTLVAGTVVALLVLLRPSLGLAFALFTAPLYLHPLSLFNKSFSLTELVLLPTIAGVLLSVLRENRKLSLRSFWLAKRRTLLPILVFVTYSLLASLLAEFRHEALREWRLVVLEPALFFCALTILKMDRQKQLRILDALVASALMIAVIGLVQYFWLDDVITAEGGIRRLRSIYGSPNNVGLYLGRVLPLLIAIGLGWMSRDSGRNSRYFSGPHIGNLLKHRTWYVAVLVPVSLALLLSFSRGAIILGIPAALLTLGFLAGKKWRTVTLVLMVIGVIALLPILRLPRFAGLFDLSGGTTGFRISLWTSSIQMIKDNPIFGVGLDNFLYAYRSRYVLPTAWEEFNLSHPHNVILDFTCRLGLPGLVIFLWMQVVFWRDVAVFLRIKDVEVRAMCLGIAASMVNFLAHGLVDASYFVIDLAYVYMFSFAAVQWLKDWHTTSEVLNA